MTHVYITLHSPLFLKWQLPAIRKHVPGAVIHLVATRNASAAVRQMADLELPQMATVPLFHALAPLVTPGPGLLLEWDMLPIAPVRIRNAVNVEPDRGPYPSVAMWTDRPSLEGVEHLAQPYVEEGCGQDNHFRIVDGSILHFHHWAAGRRPFGLHPDRLECWRSLVDSPGLGDRIAAGLAAIGITEERVSRLVGRPCGCGARKRRWNEWGRRLGIGGKVE